MSAVLDNLQEFLILRREGRANAFSALLNRLQSSHGHLVKSDCWASVIMLEVSGVLQRGSPRGFQPSFPGKVCRTTTVIVVDMEASSQMLS